MATVSLAYQLNHRLPVPAIAAYKWCTGSLGDGFPFEPSRGKLQTVAEDTFVLTARTVGSEKGAERALIKLDSTRLSWSTTYLSGPEKYSQFLYQITPEGANASSLDSTAHRAGLPVGTGKPKTTLSEHELRREELRWSLLTKKMEKEIAPHWFNWSVRKILNAPMKEVFEWCTDYQDTDAELAHMIEHTHKEADTTSQRMTVLERSETQVRYVCSWNESNELVRQYTTVHLHPPDHWIAVGTGNRWDGQALFKLTPRNGSTILDLTTFNRYKNKKKPDLKKMSKFSSTHWDTIIEEFDHELARK